MIDAGFAPSWFQQQALLVPESVDLFLGGGRGGGKSVTLALLAMRHVEQYGGRARVLYVRRTYPGIADFELLTRELFGQAYESARYNSQAHTWRLPSGAIVELGQLDGPQDYAKYQGRSFTLLLLDEVTQWGDLRMVDLLRSNLRAPAGMPTRTVMAGNPGGLGHQAVARRFVFGREPWREFVDDVSRRPMVYAPSTARDNPVLDVEAYTRQLEAACSGDPELLKAWRDGSWHIARGAYFGDVLEESRSLVEAWERLPAVEPSADQLGPEARELARRAGPGDDWPAWSFYLSMDYGVAAPSVVYFCADSPGAYGPDGRFYPRGSLVLFDEFDTRASNDDLNRGTGLSIPEIAARVKALCAFWHMAPQGVADDAIFARLGLPDDASIASEFSRCGVYFERANKGDRFSGWGRLRTLMAQAGMPDRPGLYVSRRCTGFWATVPFLARDERRIEDVDTRGPDHWGDAARYACQRERQLLRMIHLPRVH
ncbi:MAG: phage terminase large subunit [Chromatiales bacterium]|nr:phage terminase large subunit [Chromatiales bacterium]